MHRAVPLGVPWVDKESQLLLTCGQRGSRRPRNLFLHSMKFSRAHLVAYHTSSSACPVKLKRIAAVPESHRLSLCAWKSSVMLKPAGTGTPWSAGPGGCMQHWGWSPQRAWECWGMWWLKCVKAVPRSVLTLHCCKLPCCSARSTPGHDSIHSYRQI